MTGIGDPSRGLDSSTTIPLRILETFCEAAPLSFDRILAARALMEAERAIPGDTPHAVARRLIDAGASLGLRVRSVDAEVFQALRFVQQGIPLAAHDAAGRWRIVRESKGRKVRVLEPESGAERWLTARQLKQELRTAAERSPTWVVGQPALACAAVAGGDHEPHEHATPFRRLLGLIYLERKDLWVLVVFSAVVGLLAMSTPIAVEALVNTVAFGRFIQPVIVLSILLFTFLAFAAALRGLIHYVTELLQRRIFVRVVEDLAYRLPRVRQTALDGEHGPELTNRFFDVLSVQKITSSLLLDGVSIVLSTLIGMFVLAFYHPFLLGFDIVLLALLLFTVFGLGRGAVRTAIGESKAKYEVAGWLQELARHPTAFKLHGGAPFGLERADQLAIDWLDARRKHFRVVLRQLLFALGMQAAATTALLGLGGWLVIRGELTLGQLVAAELIVMVVVGSFAKLGKHLEGIYDLLASLDKLGHLFDLPIERQDKLFHVREGGAASLEFRGVTVGSPGGGQVMSPDFTLAPGERVALWSNGSEAASTLADLAAGLRQPESGHVELDGIDVRELRPDSLREHVALARGIEVFRGTIEENVHLNRPYLTAADVREALAAVALLDEALQLHDGLNTELATNGWPLSPSQAQRLMLARAVVGRPRLLVVDGTLDGLPDAVLGRVLEGVLSPATEGTVLILTGRREIAEACQRCVGLSEGWESKAGKAGR